MKEKPMLAPEVELLECARRGLGPNASQRTQALARLGAALDSLASAPFEASLAPRPSLANAPLDEAPRAPTSGSAATPPAATGLARFSVQSMLFGVLAGAAVGFGAGVLVSSADSPPAAPRPAATLGEQAPRAPVTTPAPAPKVLVAPPKQAPAPAAEGWSGRRRLGEVRQEAAPATSASSGTAPATFYEELSYVRRAQSALQQGNATLALGLMQSLAEIQPKGALMAERNMTQVLALCQLDRSEEASTIARSMLAGDGTAEVYRRRLARSCAGASLSIDKERRVKDPVE
ncbi:MAG TPA: hypothetical protein VFU02_12875 [Polyangiaceae bacterium]|nr:hypothetical protein [Polyangiaceae bacterium]